MASRESLLIFAFTVFGLVVWLLHSSEHHVQVSMESIVAARVRPPMLLAEVVLPTVRYVDPAASGTVLVTGTTPSPATEHQHLIARVRWPSGWLVVNSTPRKVCSPITYTKLKAVHWSCPSTICEGSASDKSRYVMVRDPPGYGRSWDVNGEEYSSSSGDSNVYESVCALASRDVVQHADMVVCKDNNAWREAVSYRTTILYFCNLTQGPHSPRGRVLRSTWKRNASLFCGSYADRGHYKNPSIVQAIDAPESDNIGHYDSRRSVAENRQWKSASGHPAVTMELMPDNMGFTNQLLALAGLWAVAVRSRRVALTNSLQDVGLSVRTTPNAILSTVKRNLPKYRANLVVTYLDLNASYLPAGLFLADTKEGCNDVLPLRKYAPTARLLRAFGTMYTTNSPHEVLHRLDAFLQHSETCPVVALTNMFLKYPFEQDGNLDVQPSRILCGVRFSQGLHAAAAKVVSQLADLHGTANITSKKQIGSEEGAPFLGVHLRFEPLDSFALFRDNRNVTKRRFLSFFQHQVLLLAKKHGVSIVYVASNGLWRDWLTELKAAAADVGTVLVTKRDLLMVDPCIELQLVLLDVSLLGVNHQSFVGAEGIPSADGSAGVSSVCHSILDLLILEKAAAVVTAAYSSFSASIYARRCGGVGCSNTRNTYLYNLRAYGGVSKLVHQPCGHWLSNFIRGPPALVFPQPYLEELDPDRPHCMGEVCDD